jgi:hypothetical protein
LTLPARGRSCELGASLRGTVPTGRGGDGTSGPGTVSTITGSVIAVERSDVATTGGWH